MPKYIKTNITSKKGVNFIRTAVEIGGSLFHKIEAENDLGIDAIVELIRDEIPLNKQVALQIKSGDSYYKSSLDECRIPIKHHRHYWLNYSLPVIGIVYIESLDSAHWINIKEYLKDHPDHTEITFTRSEANYFSSSTFSKLFIPYVVHEAPDLPISEAIHLVYSDKPDESYLGLVVLFRRYPNSIESWKHLLKFFVEKDVADIPPIFIYYLAHIPGHEDIWYKGEQINEQTKAYVSEIMADFSRNTVLKLLDFIEEENSIARGTIGQSVEAIISSLPQKTTVLESIALDSSLSLHQQEYAAFILAINNGEGAIPILEILRDSGSPHFDELIMHIKEYGGINPYA